ncbi:MAG: FecR domain-containing protein [Asticcacaulis sp.]
MYQTAKGERRQVALADGSVLMLNTDTKVSVQMGAHDRKLTLDHGEVALKVTHDAARPLTLTAGDTTIRDLGTEFDVLRDAGSVKVAVREGEVSLGHGQTLRAGDMSLHQEGRAGNDVSRVDADEALRGKRPMLSIAISPCPSWSGI